MKRIFENVQLTGQQNIIRRPLERVRWTFVQRGPEWNGEPPRREHVAIDILLSG